jgi:hypothetical protein
MTPLLACREPGMIDLTGFQLWISGITITNIPESFLVTTTTMNRFLPCGWFLMTTHHLLPVPMVVTTYLSHQTMGDNINNVHSFLLLVVVSPWR